MLAEGMAAMEQYSSGSGCRRRLLLSHFGEASLKQNCGMCDNCLRPPPAQSRDLAAEARLLLAAIQQTGGRFGSGVPLAVLRGSERKDVKERNLDKCACFGRGRNLTEKWWKALFYLLEREGMIEGYQANFSATPMTLYRVGQKARARRSCFCLLRLHLQCTAHMPLTCARAGGTN